MVLEERFSQEHVFGTVMKFNVLNSHQGVTEKFQLCF